MNISNHGYIVLHSYCLSFFKSFSPSSKKRKMLYIDNILIYTILVLYCYGVCAPTLRSTAPFSGYLYSNLCVHSNALSFTLQASRRRMLSSATHQRPVWPSSRLGAGNKEVVYIYKSCGLLLAVARQNTT